MQFTKATLLYAEGYKNLHRQLCSSLIKRKFWCIQYLLDCKSVLQGTDCLYFTYELIANPVHNCRFVPKNANKIVFVVYECLKSISPFKEKVIIVIKNLDNRFQEIGYILHFFLGGGGIWKLIGGIFIKYKGIRLIEI